MSDNQPTPSRWNLLAAFAAVYLIWGSTYLGIRIAIETIPPFLMAGIRLCIAGTIIYFWARLKGAARPTLAHWKNMMILGGLLFLGGNGGVVWAESGDRVSSGLAALITSATPIWVALFGWLAFKDSRPGGKMVVGLASGLAGVILLVGPANLAGGSRIDPLGTLALILGSLSWSIGSLYASQVSLPKTPLIATAMEMLCGSLLLLIGGTLIGEWGQFDPGRVALKSVLALLYLVVFGSMIAFSAYVWLLRVTTPARATSHSYVNPVVALILGWALADEPLSLRTLIAATVIVASVVMITTYSPPELPRETPAQDISPAPLEERLLEAVPGTLGTEDRV
jgi:drug/metabolite transporter (DMT)-like permease